MPCLFIMAVTPGSMKVRLARAAEDNRKVSADEVRLDNTGGKERSIMQDVQMRGQKYRIHLSRVSDSTSWLRCRPSPSMLVLFSIQGDVT